MERAVEPAIHGRTSAVWHDAFARPMLLAEAALCHGRPLACAALARLRGVFIGGVVLGHGALIDQHGTGLKPSPAPPTPPWA